MRILICHAYFLGGSPEDLYVQNISRALCRLGHQLVVTCQEDDPKYDFATSFLLEQAGGINPHVAWDKDTEYDGSCLMYRPDVGKLLPVYFLESYPEFEAREFTNLSEDDFDEYIKNYRRVFSRLVDQFVPEIILINHALSLPYAMRPVAESAGVPYFVAVHSGEFESTAYEETGYRGFAARGMAGAKGIFADGGTSGEFAAEILDDLDYGWKGRIIDVPPGVDIGKTLESMPPIRETVDLIASSVESRLSRVTIGDFLRLGNKVSVSEDPLAETAFRVDEVSARHPEGLPDRDIEEKLKVITRAERSFFLYAGELDEKGGVQNILPALPFVMEEYPETTVLICGSGKMRGILELMMEALQNGDITELRKLCKFGNKNYNTYGKPFSQVTSFLDQLKSDGLVKMYKQLCSGLKAGQSAVFCGYLYQEEYRDILPYAKGVLVPSLEPPAARSIVLEAMASGVVPIAPHHPALDEILEPVEQEWGDALLLSTGSDAVSSIATACRELLRSTGARIESWGMQARDIVAAKYSWDSVAQRMTAVFEDFKTD